MNIRQDKHRSVSVSNSQFDAIVIGGGHNGLVNAAYLAKSGLKTLVLERRSMVGGAAITEELLPGFKFTTFSYALSLIRPDIVEDLDLVEHGMLVLPMPHTFQPGLAGTHLLLGPDKHENFHAIAEHSISDAEAYLDFSHLVDRVCFALKPIMDSIPPNSTSQLPEEVRRRETVRNYFEGLDDDVKSLIEKLWNGSAAEVLDEYFESELVKSQIASSAIIGSMVGPRSKESGLVWLFHKMGEYDGEFGEWGFHKDGNGGFTQVLARAVRAYGGTVKTDAGVAKVVYRDGVASGVLTEDGDEFFADVVVSALDPKRTFLQLVEPADLPEDLVESIQQFKFQGSAAKVNFALSGLPQFPGLEGRKDIFTGFINLGPSIEYLESAFADAKEGKFSRSPFIDCCIQSTVDPDLTPGAQHVMSCFVMYAPYQLKDGNWDREREKFGDVVVETIEKFFPGFTKLILHREVVTPLDIERVVGLSEGNIFAGEMFSEQMFLNRPAPGWNQYRTPIEGYYQCGSGTHPGGCVIGAPGKLAAKQILGDIRRQ